MDVNLIFKIAAVGILVSVLSQVLKHSGREEQAFLTSLAGLLLVLEQLAQTLEELRRTMDGKVKLCRSIGVIGGIFLVILLL